MMTKEATAKTVAFLFPHASAQVRAALAHIDDFAKPTGRSLMSSAFVFAGGQSRTSELFRTKFMNIKLIAATTALIGATLGMTPSARAVTISKPMIVDPSMACQLSLPTIDTAVRPRATGYRNEGTSGTFVICGTAYFSNSVNVATSLQLQMTSFDGATHTAVSCTAVNRQSAGGGEAFSTKILDVGPAGASFAWAPADLNTFNGFMNSVTCNMPQGTSITAVRLVFPDDVGS